MKKYYFILSALLVIVFSSCSSLRIEKRHYRNGFYVHLNQDRKSPDVNNNDLEPREPSETAVVDEPATGPASTTVLPAEAPSSTPVAPAPEQKKDALSKNVATDQPVIHDQKNPATVGQSEEKNPQQNTNDSDVALVLLVILAIIVPPVAVFLVEGASTTFWITLILALLGGGIFFYPVIGGLYLVAIILALLVVFGAI